MLAPPHFFIPFILSALLTCFLDAQIKETHQLIKEWVQTKQLISEEKNTWKTEKSTLLDLDEALTKEISELEEKLQQFEKENVGAAEQRANLTKRRENAQKASLQFHQEMGSTEKKINQISKLLPTPLWERSTTFLEKIKSENSNRLSLRKRLDATISLLQSIHLFHRAVHLERQEFSLDDGKSREFRVLYFGLGIAYFVNESGTVAGWGKPSNNGWIWTRQDNLAQEISEGVAIMENCALPRFLNLPIPITSSIGQ